MNRSNGTPVDVSEIERFLGLPQTVAAPIFFATYIRGGCGKNRHFFVATLILSISLPRSGFPASTRPSRAQEERRGERRERPPPFCRSIGKQEKGFVAGFVAYPAPPFLGGRSRLIYPCGKAPNLNPKRALRRRRQAP